MQTKLVSRPSPWSVAGFACSILFLACLCAASAAEVPTARTALARNNADVQKNKTSLKKKHHRHHHKKKHHHRRHHRRHTSLAHEIRQDEARLTADISRLEKLLR